MLNIWEIWYQNLVIIVHFRVLWFFFHWHYSPPWVLACRTISFHFFLSATNSLHLLTPSTWRSLSTSSFHLILALPLLLVPSSSWVKIFMGILSTSILSRWRNQLILCPFIHFTVFCTSSTLWKISSSHRFLRINNTNKQTTDAETNMGRHSWQSRSMHMTCVWDLLRCSDMRGSNPIKFTRYSYKHKNDFKGNVFQFLASMRSHLSNLHSSGCSPYLLVLSKFPFLFSSSGPILIIKPTRCINFPNLFLE